MFSATLCCNASSSANVCSYKHAGVTQKAPRLIVSKSHFVLQAIVMSPCVMSHCCLSSCFLCLKWHVWTMQVAIQCVAPAAILLGCAIILLQHNNAGQLANNAAKPTEILQIPISFWMCIADFCGWWTCTCWFLYGAGSLAMIKSGLLQA